VSTHLDRINFFTPIQNYIHLVEERMREQPDGHHPDLYSALEHLLSSGGKRVRPAVALLTGGMYGADPERLITLGAAIELLHTATLVHDDLIDGALFRRGIATLNARWSPAATVLTGDYVFARAAKLAADTDSVDVMRLFADTLATIVSGELSQMFTSRGLISRDDYYRRIYAKTASMFELATVAAAVLSPVDDEIVNSARQVGNDIGMAFQIVDDVLDFTGEQATVGKPLASDLRQGLVTLPAIFYIETHPDDPDLDSLLNNQFYNEEWLDRIVHKIRQSGAIEQAMDEARHFINCALETLRLQPECTERLALEDLAQYIVHRSL